MDFIIGLIILGLALSVGMFLFNIVLGLFALALSLVGMAIGSVIDWINQ